jgi:ribosomal subunit interface protein
MSLRVSGKNIDIGESLRTYVGARLDQVLLKFSAEPAGGRVVIEREGSGFRTDCTLHLNAGLTLQAEAAAQDAYSSFDKAAVRIEARLRRCKRRLKDRASGHFTP